MKNAVPYTFLLIFCLENFVCSLGLLQTFRRTSGKMLPCKRTLMSSLTRVHNVCNKGYVRKCARGDEKPADYLKSTGGKRVDKSRLLFFVIPISGQDLVVKTMAVLSFKHVYSALIIAIVLMVDTAHGGSRYI